MEEQEKDLNNNEGQGEGTSDTKAKEDQMEVVKLARDIASLQEAKKREEEAVQKLRDEKKALKKAPQQEEQPVKTEVESDVDFSTVDGVIKQIDKQSREVTKPLQNDIAALKKTQFEKAKRKFLEDHPEYKEEERFESLIEKYHRYKSQSDLDSESIIEDMEAAWAIENKSILLEKERKMQMDQHEANEELAHVASSGFSSGKSVPENIKASQEDIRAAKIANMDLKKYMSLKSQLEDSFI